jgi:hypothetical protein
MREHRRAESFTWIKKERWKLETNWKMAPLKKIQNTKSTTSVQGFYDLVFVLLGDVSHHI